ncbi:MAG: hypothetical protein A3G76_04755 [Acidobacteria bacterium RIFCSPLOWO2_12_FULL_65_11]|nr:MAG: hypothetical protein A3H95_03190 [Acidobacteria bacterium RIFCSPLOWO2_02_FULL_64_15]OFW31295.1 MAG: hypothetical protein A3G76_04755 [Acidobacteria bacterium RIFCSPLOWO2_12_FULL_65_11]
MPLDRGTQVGLYVIDSLIGAGGMGEVYRARDPKLNRDVALKVLPAHFALDADRLARFKREAQVLASLNHPNIAAIYGFEEAAGVQALVLELVEGPTLADRIGRKPIPLDEALPIARQIAEAVEAAHEIGIVHRDLKPANVKVRPDGAVKVLDFGLAKAVEGDAAAPVTSNSPTLSMGATVHGVILGTAAYMAPEQARGKKVDKRADVWAFGCVLYEMLTGKRAFGGDELSDTLAAVLRAEPDWTALPSSTPRAIRRLLHRCLEKEAHERLQAIGDARLEIKESLTAAGDDAAAAVPAPSVSLMRRFAPVVGALVVTAVAVGIGTWTLKPSVPATQPVVTRSLIAVQPFDQRTPAGPSENRLPLARPDRTAIALSPDGLTLVFRGTRGRGMVQLFMRALDRLDATPIPGTEGADSPFFSGDGTWIGFWANGELRKVPLAGGPVSAIGKVPGGGAAPRAFGASWGDGDVIVFATSDGLWRVKAAGGQPESVSKPSEIEHAHYLPSMLPGGEAILFTLPKTGFRWDDAQIVVRSLVTGVQKVLLEDGADARYVPTGHIVFARRGTLMAVPFDLARLELTGGAVALIDGVMQAVAMGNFNADSGAGQFAMADRGTLIYATGGIAPDQERALVWVDRNGTVEALAAPPREYLAPRLAPDGQRVAVFTQAPGARGNQRVWIYNVPRRTVTPLTTGEEQGFWNIWSPDGARIAFTSAVGGRLNLFWKSADGTGESERLTTSEYQQRPSSWSSDGNALAFVQTHPATGNDIWVLDVGSADHRPRPVVQTPADERFPAFSTDGRWLAYTSNEAGREEVFVRPYPGPGSRVQVSTGGGRDPAWKFDGSELFYGSSIARDLVSLMAVPVKSTPAGFSAGIPRKLFEGRYQLTAAPIRSFDVTANGQRFLMVQPLDPRPEPPTELVLVTNWFEELKARVRATR